MKKLKFDNNSEKEKLIAKNYGLLISQVLSFKPKTSEDFDDLVSVGSIGMIKAIDTWNPNKGQLSTHIVNCIRNRIKNYLKAEQFWRHWFDKVDVIRSFYRQKSKHEINHKFNDIPIIHCNIQDYIPFSLNDEEQTLLNMKFAGYTRKEIANILGFSKNQIKYKLLKLFRKIREANEETNTNGK